MNLRIARHTSHIEPITAFYCDVLGLQVLGSFTGHDGYDGIFIGLPGLGWHLEFTVSGEPPAHSPDDDDLLVFYTETPQQYNGILSRFAVHNILPVAPKNPYWATNGTTFTDPDGYRVVISLKAGN